VDSNRLEKKISKIWQRYHQSINMDGMEWMDGIIKSSLYTKSYQSIKQTLPTGLWKTHKKKTDEEKSGYMYTGGGGN
jgi:hypothetical protein